MKIIDIDAIQLFDSRGNPTVEATVTLDDGSVGRGIVPSGASTGKLEAWELRDGNPLRFRGKSVYQAVANVQGPIRDALLKLDEPDQRAIDQQMISLDSTDNRSFLGANAILSVSMAFCVAVANSQKLALYEHLGQGLGNLIPLPEIQIVGGGAHAARTIDIQDFMVIATQPSSFEEALEITFNVYRETETLLRERGLLVGVADEGGFWPLVDRNEDVFELLLKAIERAGYTAGSQVAFSLDIAASDLHHDGAYLLASENRRLTTKQFAQLQIDWARNYPIVSIEDPMDENDWQGWQQIMDELGDAIQIIGDDLFTTNIHRIEMGIEKQAANAVLIKLNQIGTVSETLDAIQLTQRAGWNPIVSARSGETEDTFIAHLAVATNAGQLKVGSFSRSERMAKWNEVLRIEKRLGDKKKFLGGDILLKPPRNAAGLYAEHA